MLKKWTVCLSPKVMRELNEPRSPKSLREAIIFPAKLIACVCGGLGEMSNEDFVSSPPGITKLRPVVFSSRRMSAFVDKVGVGHYSVRVRFHESNNGGTKKVLLDFTLGFDQRNGSVPHPVF